MIFSNLYNTNLYTQNANLYIAVSAIFKLGVFSHAPIKKGTLIENCPLVIFNAEQSELLRNTSLYSYYFIIKPSPQQVALALGYGSIYNHQYPSNAAFSFHKWSKTIRIKAIADIAPNTEITINYNGDPNDDSEIIFSSLS